MITRREAVKKLNAAFPWHLLYNLNSNWGELEGPIKSDELPDWVWKYYDAIPDGEPHMGGYALKWNPNDPEELRMFTKRLRRNKIKRNNEMMKETKGVPQRKSW